MARTRSKTVSKDAKPEVVEVDLSDASDIQPEALANKKRSIEVDASDDEPDNADQLSIPSLVVSDDDDDESDEEESTADIKKTADSDFDSEAEREDRELEKLLGEEPSDAEFSSDEDSDGQVTYVKGADGKPRPIRPEIIPVYDSDDTDQEDNNTIGNVPLSAYDQFPHIGYDIDGKRIMRPATGSALDALLDSIDLPEGWTGLLDKETGGSLNLTKEELELVKRIQKGENPDDSVNPYEDYVDWFTGELQVTPVTAAPEPKRRFVPSKHEAKRVMKIVRAIREGRIVPNKPKKTEEEEEAENLFDIWADNMPEGTDHVMNLRAPKLPPPTNEESYNPPEEYLPDDKEREAWETADPEDRERNFLPKKYPSLRQVPGYSEGIRERFERSLDLYLAPRVRRAKLNIDPESLIPELPSPKDLRPFPIKCSTIFKGHRGRVRAVSIDPSGQFLATGGDDGTVRVWELLTGRELWRLNVVKGDSHADDEKDLEDSDSDAERDRSEDDHVDSVQWNPNAETGLLAVAAGENVYLLVPPVFDTEIENRGRELIEAGWGYASKETNGKVKSDATELDANKQDDAADDEDDDDDEPYVKKKIVANWTKPGAKLADNGVGVIVRCKKTIKKLSWHRRGDYFLTVSPAAQNTAVLVHQLSKHNSQSPFRKSKGIVQDALFHPFRPHLYVATQRYIRVYDLAAQVLAKKLQPGVRWLSGIDIHPQGDNVLASSYDKRVIWHDLDLSSKPYKTLRYHDKAVRAVRFHKTLPLFVSASDDGLINVFHGSVYDDLMKNPLLVPLKKLEGHSVVNSLGVLDVAWHSKEAWLVSAGADGTARLWTA